jgi:hypothetical protein
MELKMISQEQVFPTQTCSSTGPRGIMCNLQHGHTGEHAALQFTWENIENQTNMPVNEDNNTK